MLCKLALLACLTCLIAAPLCAQEMDVAHNVTAVADNGTSVFAGTVPAVTFDACYTITNNTMTAALLVMTVPVAAPTAQTNCTASIQLQPQGTVAGNFGTTRFLVRITVTAAAAWSCVVSITNNDATENPYNWTISGTAAASASREMDVTRNGSPIEDGAGQFPSSAPTDEAGAGIGTQPITLTYVIRNVGTANLTVNPATSSTLINCTIVFITQPTSPVTPGGQTTLVLTLTPTSQTNNVQCDIAIANDDANENAYDWHITAFATNVAAPEITLGRSGSNIPDAWQDNLLGTQTGGAPIMLTYTIGSIGTSALTVNSVPAPASQTLCVAVINTQPAASVTAGTTTTFIVQVTPTAAGTFSCIVNVTSTDTDESPYNWTISGTASAPPPAPEIAMTRAATPVPDNTTDTIAGTPSAGIGIVLNYTITNSGPVILNITLAVANPTGLVNCTATVTTQPSTTVAVSGGTTTLQITVTPAGAGAFSCNASFVNDDSDETPYNWIISGTAGPAVPEIALERQAGVDIPTPSIDNVGSLSVALASDFTYTIFNNGVGTLTLTLPIAAPGTPTNCTASITVQPVSATIAGSGTGTFNVRITATAAGAFSCTINIVNDDSNENPFFFTINGTGAAVPEMAVARGATPVTDGGASAVGNMVPAAVNALTYTISNPGSANLNLTGLPPATISLQSNCTVLVTTQPGASIVPAANSNLVLSVTVTALGAFSFDVSIDNNDSNENPYNWTVSGTGVAAPSGNGSGGSGGGGGCATNSRSGWWLPGLLLPALALILRRRSACSLR